MHARPLMMAALAALAACERGDDATGASADDLDDSAEEADADADADTDADTDADADTDLSVSIEEIQRGKAATDSLVLLSDVLVVGPQVSDGFHVTDPKGGDSHNGLWVAFEEEQASLSENDVVSITGFVLETTPNPDDPPAEGDGTLTTLDTSEGGVWQLGKGSAAQPVVVEPAVLADPETAEPYEGMLLELGPLTVTEGGTGSWRVDENLAVGALYHSATVITGASLASLTGVLWFDGSEFVLMPRQESDLVGYDDLVEDCGKRLCLSQLAVGDLVICEVMNDPEAVYDDYGEWFEIRNLLKSDVELLGLRVADEDGEGFTVTASLVLPAQSYLVFGASSNPKANGGIVVDYDYDYSSFSLSNADDEIVLSLAETVFDRVAWSEKAGFPLVSGASMSLDPAQLDATSNDDGANWCSSSSDIGTGDLGTPGVENEECPI